MSTSSPLERAKLQLTIAEVAAVIFRGWKPGNSCRSPFREDRHPSFSVYGDGRRWKDHSTGEGGDLVNFVAKARGIDEREAARELIALAGTASAERSSSAPHIEPPPRPASVAAPAILAPMPPARREAWDEGVNYLLGNPSLQDAIDNWRGWPARTTLQLARDGLVGCPIIHGKRVTGFAVQHPYNDDLDLLSTRDVGFHVRHKPPAGERAKWSFYPNKDEDRISTPALPFVIGGGFVPYAHTIIVTEGQWDAATLAAAAGWITPNAAWPERIALFGTRGVDGWRKLLDHWGRFWLPSAHFFLFADADAAGDKWTAPRGFAETLRSRGHRVHIGRSTEAGAKDLNDLHRVSPITPALVATWITPANTAGKTT